ncbi:MAG: DUF268 domain-containing protein [Synergistaceae bacterium]|jgi:SAM-dependent methyltransferase|nr:DUF268 domain-containing protein [Synergistaceae bacterium]
MIQFGKTNRRESFALQRKWMCPCLYDWDGNAGAVNYYFWQDLWAAKKIFQRKPSAHFDVASRIDGFVAHVLSFMPVTLIDIRPLPFEVEELDFVRADATDMSIINDNSVESLSSLCALEHFGLGRYGDSVDPEACFKSMAELRRILAPNGRLYISVPIGVERVYFNAHRIFAPQTILDAFPKLELADFSVIDTRDIRNPRYMEHVEPNDFANEINTESLTGLFEFKK